MRVVFAGTPLFAVPTLRALLASPHEVLAVVAQPDRPSGRGQQVTSPPTVLLARERGIPVYQPKALKSGPFPDRWAALDADVAVVVAYGRILPRPLLEAPRRGCLNVHASLLPKYRGAAPIQWSIARGETVTGVTTMRMSEGLDEGPILLQREVPIEPEEMADALALRLAEAGAGLLLETLDALDEIVPREQDGSLATFAPPLTREDGIVNWSKPAVEIAALARGLSPWPGAWTSLRDCPIRIHRATPRDDIVIEARPGTVIEARRRLIVATGRGALELGEVQMSCRKRQSGPEMVSGIHIQTGEVFT